MNLEYVSFHHIKKSFQNPSLNIERLTINQGECLIITGKNGSGKTTLLKIINGLIDADSGDINFKQKFFPAKKGHKLANHSVYLSSKTYLFNCSVERNLAYPLMIRNQFKIKQKVEQILHWAGLNHLRHRLPTNLSSGEIQKVAIARARIINPPLWLLDEPTENLDADTKQQIIELMLKLLHEQHSIIIVTHAKHLFKQIPHIDLQLKNGELINGNH